MGFLSSNVFFADYGGRENNTRPFRFCSFGDLLREANIYERILFLRLFRFHLFFFLTDLNNIYIGLKFDMLLTLSSWFWD